MLILGENVNK